MPDPFVSAVTLELDAVACELTLLTQQLAALPPRIFQLEQQRKALQRYRATLAVDQQEAAP